MTGSESLRDEKLISDDQIIARIDYLAWLEDDDLSSEADRMMWADEVEELAALRTLQEEIGSESGGLISEHYWDEYAANYADELFDLSKTALYPYFDYKSYADDLRTSYSQVEFLGTTYYYQ